MFTEIQFALVVKMFYGPNLLFFISDPYVLQEIYNGHTWMERPYMFDYFGAKNGLISISILLPIRTNLLLIWIKERKSTTMDLFLQYISQNCFTTKTGN